MAAEFALAGAVLILIVAPLLRLGWALVERLAVFFYFAVIGLGFMFLEIVWIQRFTLFWVRSLYSAVGAIAARGQAMCLALGLRRSRHNAGYNLTQKQSEAALAAVRVDNLS